jgi:hypothetical protein
MTSDEDIKQVMKQMEALTERLRQLTEDLVNLRRAVKGGEAPTPPHKKQQPPPKE